MDVKNHTKKNNNNLIFLCKKSQQYKRNSPLNELGCVKGFRHTQKLPYQNMVALKYGKHKLSCCVPFLSILHGWF